MCNLNKRFSWQPISAIRKEKKKSFLIFLHVKTPVPTTAAQHNTSNIYITTVTYWRYNCDSKSTYYTDIHCIMYYGS